MRLTHVALRYGPSHANVGVVVIVLSDILIERLNGFSLNFQAMWACAATPGF